MAYARIDEGFWTDPMIKSLSLEGKILAAWLFTNPHRHFSGLYYLPRVLIAIEIGVSIEVSNRELKVLENKGFLKYSDEYSTVWVIKMLFHQSGGVLNEKQAKGISSHLKTLHGCPLILDFLKKYKQFTIPYDGPINTPIDTPTHTKSKSQSKSQSKSKEKLGATPSPPPGGNGDARPASPIYSCECFEIDQEYFQEIALKFPLLPENYLLKVFFPKMRDWCLDNRKSPKHRKKFNSQGRLKEPRRCLSNWLKSEDPQNVERSGLNGAPEYQPFSPTPPRADDLTPDPECSICGGRGIYKPPGGKYTPCQCLQPVIPSGETNEAPGTAKSN